MQTEYNKPSGFDKARGKEIGNKNFDLTTMEEAFTSEHWIVRIYKVKKRPIVEPTKKASKERSKSSLSSEKKSSDEVSTKFIGCYISEASFSSDKKYDGDTTGANYRLALHHAKTNRKRYFAIARNAGDGHAFAFNELKSKPTAKSDSCERPCNDLEDKFCGCADQFCSERTPKGEEHNRRWAVYEILK